MPNSEEQLRNIYLNKISEALARIAACELYLAEYKKGSKLFSFESSVLQLRKSFECVAYAAIAPNKTAYKELRLKAQESTDYSKDYNARKIIQLLEKINADFYPIPLLPPVRQEGGQWHFERKEEGFLTKRNFKRFYDRLGKFLHADNPWGANKGSQNLIADIPTVLMQLRSLLEMHFTVIRTPEFNGVWVIEAINGQPPRVIAGQSNGEFAVKH